MYSFLRSTVRPAWLRQFDVDSLQELVLSLRYCECGPQQRSRILHFILWNVWSQSVPPSVLTRPLIRRYGLWPVWFRAWPTLVLGVAAHIVFYALTSFVVWKDSDVQEGRWHLAILRASTPLSLFRCLGQDRKRRESSYRCTFCLIFKCVFTLLIVIFDSGVYVTLPCCAVHLLWVS